MVGTGFIRVIHASPHTPSVNVRVDGNDIIQSLAYSESSDYVELRSGKHEIALIEENGNMILGPVNVEVSNSVYNTIIAMGLANGEPKIKLYLFSDRVTGLAAA